MLRVEEMVLLVKSQLFSFIGAIMMIWIVWRTALHSAREQLCNSGIWITQVTYIASNNFAGHAA